MIRQKLFFVDVTSFDCSLDVFLVKTDWHQTATYSLGMMLSNRIGEIHCLVESTRKPKTVNRPKFIQGASSSVCQHIHITSSEHTWILVVYLLFCFEPIPKLRVCLWIMAGRLPWFQLRLPCWVAWSGGVTPQRQVWEGGSGWGAELVSGSSQAPASAALGPAPDPHSASRPMTHHHGVFLF